MNDAGSVKPTTVYWTVAVLGFLWNAFGGWIYSMAKFNPEVALASAPPAMREYAMNAPIWADFGYGLGVWGSLAGSVLMLLRSRHAVTAFLASLLGAIASFAGQAQAGVIEAPLAAAIVAVIVFLWWFSKRETANGTLR